MSEPIYKYNQKNKINVVPLEKNKNLPIRYKEFDKLFC
jgi:hypothetical protein